MAFIFIQSSLTLIGGHGAAFDNNLTTINFRLNNGNKNKASGFPTNK